MPLDWRQPFQATDDHIPDEGRQPRRACLGQLPRPVVGFDQATGIEEPPSERLDEQGNPSGAAGNQLDSFRGRRPIQQAGEQDLDVAVREWPQNDLAETATPSQGFQQGPKPSRRSCQLLRSSGRDDQYRQVGHLS